eukprot:1878962-Pyramimonas_sp.AAC.1
MPLVMTTVRRFSFDVAPKKYWDVPAIDIISVECGGETVEFVKLHPSTSVGLPRRIFDGCPDAADKPDDGTLSRSR